MGTHVNVLAVAGRMLLRLIQIIGGFLLGLGGLFFFDGFIPKSKPVEHLLYLTHESWLGFVLVALGITLFTVAKFILSPRRHSMVKLKR